MNLPVEDNSEQTIKVGDYIGTVNAQGRVTLPEEVRKVLQVHSEAKIVFRINPDTIEIVGKLPTLEQLAGSFVSFQPQQDLDTVIQLAKEIRHEHQITQKRQS
jgi:bifunctional DNA-binding transcriptional regulator/antitoxin component of YhaV-PrlF toxin-antitoxin module